MRDRLLRACRREPVDCTPIWLMRQAGRYMPEYRKLRERYSILDMIRSPELAVEVTLQPVSRFDLDAAIVFADILPPLMSMGVEVAFVKGDGPVIANPIRTAADVEALRDPAPEEIAPQTVEAVRIASRELASKVPLIGFAGAPFTLASYLVEGGASRDFAATKRLMYDAPAAWHSLMAKLARLVGSYLVAQAKAGAAALQVFDSWVGILGPEDYREFVLPYSRQVIAAASEPGVPVIHFSVGTSGMLPTLAEAGGDVVGVDWRIELGDAWRLLGEGLAVQGNLDPRTLLASSDVVKRRAQHVLDQAAGRDGHIFNLGHGVLPDTSVDRVGELVDYVHEASRRA